jgi:hypothetical protein
MHCILQSVKSICPSKNYILFRFSCTTEAAAAEATTTVGQTIIAKQFHHHHHHHQTFSSIHETTDECTRSLGAAQSKHFATMLSYGSSSW